MVPVSAIVTTTATTVVNITTDLVIVAKRARPVLAKTNNIRSVVPKKLVSITAFTSDMHPTELGAQANKVLPYVSILFGGIQNVDSYFHKSETAVVVMDT